MNIEQITENFLKRKELEKDQWRLWDVQIRRAGDTFWVGTVVETTRDNARRAALLQFPPAAGDSLLIL
jgi:hypothetical protein